MGGIRDINAPGFFSDANIDAIAEPASFSDYGPGPNESLERAKMLSAAVREGISHAPAGDFELPAPAAASGAAGGDVVEQLADAVLARIQQKLGGF